LPCPVVLVAPPGVDEGRLTRVRDRTNAEMRRYAAAFGEVVLAAGGRVVDSPAALGPLGPEAFVEDGVHLSTTGYGALLPAVADAVVSSAAAPSDTPVALRSSVGARRW